MALSVVLLLAGLMAGSSRAQPDFTGALCPDGLPRATCTGNPCQSLCPSFPLARCQTACSDCLPHYFVTQGNTVLEVFCPPPPPEPTTEAPSPTDPPRPPPSGSPLPLPKVPTSLRCPGGCRGEKGVVGDSGWPGRRGARGLKGSAGDHGKYLIFTDGYILPSGVHVNPAQAKQQAGGKVTTASEFGPEAMGMKGERGPPGPPGVPGSHGRPGPPGRQGPPGAIGQKGEIGELGVTGPPGPIGWQGERGDQGDRGLPGVVGDQGGHGPPGVRGQPGIRGLIGQPGVAGQDGQTGDRGPPGIAGTGGHPGQRGQAGARGAKGIRGAVGTTGAQGIVGASGAAGDVGADGRAGLNGLTGSDGVEGATGRRGEYGPDIREVPLAIATPCTGGANNGKVQYDFNTDKLYFCNGREWRCVDHVDCQFSCQVSNWEPWQPCSQTCGAGAQIRHRAITAPSGPYGNPCPALSQNRVCPNTPCECRRPTGIENGDLQSPQNTYAVGEAAVFSCRRGYNFVSGGSAVCMAGGRFSSLPQCEVTRCADPGIPANGDRADGALALFYNGRVTYSCNSGYELSGSASLVCQASGLWSAARPSCVPVDCGDPGTPVNGANDAASTTFGATASFSCNDGYLLTGEQSLTCTAEGQWSDARPTCMPVSCSNPGTPEHGFIAVTSPPYGYRSTATFSCRDGYALIGSAVRMCQSNGQWSGTQPVCNARACPRVTAPENGEITTFAPTFSIGSRIAFACSQGYTLQGVVSLLCQDSGAWNNPAPLCQRKQCCHLSEPANGRLRMTGTMFADTAAYSCDDGYRLEGSVTRTCQTIGAGAMADWSGRSARCIPIQCPDPQAPENGSRDPAFSLFFAGDTVAYSCPEGHRMVGQSSRTCQADGTWDNDLPNCQVIFCADPGIPTNGARSGNSLQALTDLMFSCNANFRLNGPETRRCQADGTYSGVMPTCDPDCVVSEWSSWSQCSVSCGDGEQIRTRTITQFSEGVGVACPGLGDSQPCNPRQCPLCYGQFGASEAAHVVPRETVFAADVMIVVEHNQDMARQYQDIQDFMVEVEADLRKSNTGTDPSLPNMYSVVAFGNTFGEGRECGHFIVPASAEAGQTSFNVDDAMSGLVAAQAGPPSQLKDGYQAMKFAMDNTRLRPGPNIAHNLIFLSPSSRTTGCGDSTVTKRQLRQQMIENGVHPNFIIDHRIKAGIDKAEEVLGIRALQPTFNNDRLAYLRERGGVYREALIDNRTGIDYREVIGTIAADYTELTFSTGGMMWNYNAFQDRFRGSEFRSFQSAFTEIKAREMANDARACKVCTCTDDGALGVFKCQRNFESGFCQCRANGGSETDCRS